MTDRLREILAEEFNKTREPSQRQITAGMFDDSNYKPYINALHRVRNEALDEAAGVVDTLVECGSAPGYKDAATNIAENLRRFANGDSIRSLCSKDGGEPLA